MGAGVQARHQVEDVAERHWVQVFNERREKVVDVAATVFQLKTQKQTNKKFYIWGEGNTKFFMKWYRNYDHKTLKV